MQAINILLVGSDYNSAILYVMYSVKADRKRFHHGPDLEVAARCRGPWVVSVGDGVRDDTVIGNTGDATNSQVREWSIRNSLICKVTGR